MKQIIKSIVSALNYVYRRCRVLTTWFVPIGIAKYAIEYHIRAFEIWMTNHDDGIIDITVVNFSDMISHFGRRFTIRCLASIVKRDKSSAFLLISIQHVIPLIIIKMKEHPKSFLASIASLENALGILTALNSDLMIVHARYLTGYKRNTYTNVTFPLPKRKKSILTHAVMVSNLWHELFFNHSYQGSK